MADSIFSFGLETEYNGVEEAKKAVKSLRQEIDKASKLEINVDEKEIQKAKQHLNALEQSIAKTEKQGGNFSTVFNKELGKVQKETKETEKSIGNVERKVKALEKSSRGGSGFSAISKSARIATRDIQQTETQLDKLKTNLQQGIGQTIAFAGIGAITTGVTKMISDVRKLDDIMMNISIVSGKSAEEMERYRDAAGKTADTLGTLGSRYLDASLIYEQQGGQAAYYAQELAQATVVAANISQESTSQMSEYLTATINGFQLLKEKGGEAGTYVTDVLAKLGAASGSDLSEIATGLTRTANTAKDVGFEFEEISTMIATVSEVTRRTPETIGNAFKSMLTSFTQLREAGEKDVEEFTNKIEDAFKLAGIENISIFDQGNLRDASDIFKDIGSNWDKMDKEGQSLVSEAVAGKYQAEVFRAFMNNQERYSDLLGDAYDSAGTSAMQQIVFMDSLEAKTNQMGNAWEQVSAKIIDGGAFRGVLEQMTAAFQTVADSESSFGAIAKLMAPLGAMFSGAIGKGAGSFLGEKIWGSASDMKNIKAALDAEKGLSVEAKKRQLEDLERGNQQRKLKESMTASDAAYYENALTLQEKLNEKIGEQNALLEKSKTDAGLTEITDRVLTKGGVAGMDGKSTSAARDLGQSIAIKENQEVLKLDKQILNVNKQIENIKIKASSTKKTIADTEASIAKSLEEININKNLYKTKKSMTQVEKEREAIVNRLLSTEKKSDDEARVNKLEGIELLKKLKQQEEKRTEELRKQKELRESSRKSIIEEEGLMAAKKAAKKEISGVSIQNQRDQDEMYAAKAEAEAIEKNYKQKQRLQKGISGVMSAYGALMPVMSAYNSVVEGTITQSEGLVTATNGVAMALITSGNPMLMAAGAVTGLVGQIGKATGTFESDAEKIKKTNESLIRSFMSLDEQAGQKMSLLTEVQDSYKKFQGVSSAEVFASPAEGISREEEEAVNKRKAEYLELSEKIAKVAPELVQYYDEQGRAIVDLTGNYDDLMDKMKEEKMLVADILAQNSESFAAELSGNVEGEVEKIEEATKKLAELNEERRKLQSEKGSEKELAKNLAAIQEQNSELSKSADEIKKSKDAVQSQIVKPYFEANRQLASLAESNKELFSQASEFVGSQFNQESIMTMFEDDYQEGVNVLKNNLDMVLQKVNELEAKKPGDGKSYLDSIIGDYSEQSKLILQDNTFETIEDLNAALEAQEERYTKVTEGAEKYSEALVASRNNETENIKVKAESARATEDELQEIEKRIKAGEEVSKSDKKRLEQMREINKERNNFAIPKEKQTDSTETPGLNANVDNLKNLELELGRIEDSFERSSGSAKGFNEAVEDLGEMESAIKGVREIDKEVKNLGLNTFDSLSEEFDKLKEKSPEVAEALRKIEESDATEGEKRSEAMTLLATTSEVALERYGAAVQGMMQADNSVFQNWQQQNNEKLSAIDELYGTSLEKAQTYDEAMASLSSIDEGKMQEINDLMLKSNEDLQSALEEKRKDDVKSTDESEKKKTELKLDADMIAYLNTIETNGDMAKSYQEMSATSIEAIYGIANALDRLSGKTSSHTKDLKDLSKAAAEESGAIDKKTKELIDDAKSRELKTQKDIDAANKRGEKRGNRLYSQFFGTTGADTVGNASTGLSGYMPHRKTPEELLAERKAEEAKNKAERDKKDRDKKEKEKKEKKDKKVENIKLELNKYVDLENQLKKVTAAMSDLKLAKDMAYGSDKVKAMEKEQKLLKQQADLSGKYAKRLAKEQSDLRNKLSGKGFGFSGDDLTNQNANLKARERAVNATKDPEAKEKAKKALQELQKDVDRYNDVTYNLIPDKKRAKEEARKAISDIAREKIEYQVKLKVDKTELKRHVLDVVGEFKEGFDNIDERMQLTQKSTQSYLGDIATYQKELRDVQNNSDLSADEKQGMVLDIKNKILSAVSSAKGAYDKLGELQKEFTSDAIKAIDKVASNYDRVISKAQSMIDLQKELYGAKNQKDIQKYYDIQEKALEGSIGSQQKAMNGLIDYRKTLKEGTAAWEETNEAVNKLAEDIESKLMEKMKLLKSRWNDFVDGMLKKVDDSFGTWGLDGAKSEFDKLVQQQDEYMSGFDKLNTIGGKIAEINKQIAQTTDPAQAKMLADYRDKELKNLMAQDEVSKAEYERAMKLLEIKQKEMAMSERENASRVAQLVRDEAGNMTYEYVRGEESDMSKEYEELQNMKDDLIEFDESQVKAAGSKIFEIIARYQDKVKQLSDKGLSTEDYKKELDKLLKEAQTDMDAQQSIIDKWMANLGTDGIDKLKDMFKDEVLDPKQMGLDANQMNDFFAGMQSGKINMGDMIAGDSTGFGQAMGMEGDEAKEAMDKIMGYILGKNSEIVDALKDASNTWSDTAGENVNILGKEYDKYMNIANDTLNRYNATTAQLNKLLKDTNANSKQVIQTIDRQTEAMKTTTNATDKTSKSVKNLEKMLIGAGGGGLFGSMVQLKNQMNNKLQPSLRTTEKDSYKVSKAALDASRKMTGFAKESDTAYKKTKQFAGQPIKDANNQIDIMGRKSERVYRNFNTMGENAKKAQSKIGDLKRELAALPGAENIMKSTEKEIGSGRRGASFASGGYTGTWNESTGNKEGRMAMLHEKELVLNKQDTANILEAVNLQRKLMANIGNRDSGTRSVINNQNMTNKVINNNSNERIIQSSPVINASFPEARNSGEIERAFEGLFTKASTFISKN